MRTAPNPAGPWSPEIALLSSGPLPPAPYDTVQVAVNDLDPSLAPLLVYSEPGAFYADGVLYLSLTGLVLTGPDRIILLASDDHGATWRYVGTPLTQSDASALGFLSFDGSALASEAGRVYLLTAPESAGILHDGTLVLEFADLAAGALLRSNGVPVVSKYLPAIPGLPAERRGGQSDYAEESTTGVLQPSLHLEDYPEFFQIFASGETLAAAQSVPAMGPKSILVASMLIVLLAGAGVFEPRPQ